jgi:hypothetical protein
MSDQARARMTSDEFLAWAIGQGEGEHYELVAGEVVAMAPSGLRTPASREASTGA